MYLWAFCRNVQGRVRNHAGTPRIQSRCSEGSGFQQLPGSHTTLTAAHLGHAATKNGCLGVRHYAHAGFSQLSQTILVLARTESQVANHCCPQLLAWFPPRIAAIPGSKPAMVHVLDPFENASSNLPQRQGLIRLIPGNYKAVSARAAAASNCGYTRRPNPLRCTTLRTDPFENVSSNVPQRQAHSWQPRLFLRTQPWPVTPAVGTLYAVPRFSGFDTMVSHSSDPGLLKSHLQKCFNLFLILPQFFWMRYSQQPCYCLQQIPKP